ncbi:hypothetical protein RHMOL_Rhmol02G0125500 [Rhododendron molle]|nr:hypothetical protein RHMOL_Rhmol02G0125500 [Rhododendron molle]
MADLLLVHLIRVLITATTKDNEREHVVRVVKVPPCHEGKRWESNGLSLRDSLGKYAHPSLSGPQLFARTGEDVWTELGRPCGIHQKQLDQMVKHMPLMASDRIKGPGISSSEELYTFGMRSNSTI